MKPDAPILFADPMIRAILREIEAPGTGKTETRRVLPAKLQAQFDRVGEAIIRRHPHQEGLRWRTGMRLWVREAWATDAPDLDSCQRGVESDGPAYGPYYRATASKFDLASLRWRPSIHMPRWASQITLDVAEVCVERLQDITEDGAKREGTREPSLRNLGGELAQAAWCEKQVFMRLWEHLHGPGAWDANPWVAAIRFVPHPRNIDDGEKT